MLANPSRIFLTLAVALVGVSAQNLDSCIVTCLSNAAQAQGSCTNIQDLSCVCNNTVFKTAAANCLTANCTAQDQQTALQLEQSQCGNTATSSSTGSATSPTAKSKSGATPIGQSPFFIAGAVIGGAALGAIVL
ncbi:hypothetical protein BGW80DRAFT_1293861 [Lactifluus volemus]|nr:hypothetical protein BGW80DRAFT_1293861 [Lactifluus volemus]